MTEGEQLMDTWMGHIVERVGQCVVELVSAGTDPATITTERESDLRLAPCVISVAGEPRMRVSIAVYQRSDGQHVAQLLVEDSAS